MKSLLHTLNDNEAVLLMYLFDELPAEDRAEVDEMLLTDSGLRTELELLKDMHGSIDDALAMSDVRLTSSRSEAAIRRGTYKLVDQWNTRRLLKQAVVVKPAASRLKWVMYASGVAVAALVAMSYFWVMSTDDHYMGGRIGGTLPVTPEQEERLANSFEDKNSPENTDGLADARSIESSDLLRKSLDSSEELLNDSLTHVDLAAAERELQAIAILSDVRTINGEADDQNLLQ